MGAFALHGVASPDIRSSPATLKPRHLLLGRSVRGRRIEAVELGSAHAHKTTLVIGCIHGNEPAGIAIAHRLERSPAPTRYQLLVVADLNPDGVGARTRQNAHGVDLNRNFPLHWRQ